MTGDGQGWVESTRNVRFLVYGFFVLMGGAIFAVQGKWVLAASIALGGAAMLGAFWWLIQSVQRTPSIDARDIEKSVKRVGGNR